MAINIGRLWRDSGFNTLSPESKLLYIYLCTNPNILSLGLSDIIVQVAMIELNLTEDIFRKSCTQLRDRDYIKIYPSKKEGGVYFFVKGHFETLPKSVAVSNKANKEIASLPEYILDHLLTDGCMPNVEQHSDFMPPSKEEVESYSVEQGYIINGNEFISFYEDNAKRLGKSKGWYDSNGRQVKDWKAKLRKVWFRKAKKILEHKDAPKGFEYYMTRDDEGNILFPKGWRKGLPYGENMYEDKLLVKGFNELRENS